MSWSRSLGFCPLASSSTGFTPTRRRHQFAALFNALSSGRLNHMNPRIGMASMMADLSGCAIAHDFGAISPTTRCRNVTTTRASTNPTTSAAQNGAPKSSNTGVSQWWTAGLVMAPSARTHTVIPSCEPASSTLSSVELRSAARAARLSWAASSRRCCLAAINANSTATKNALRAMINTVATATTTGFSITRQPLGGPVRRW